MFCFTILKNKQFQRILRPTTFYPRSTTFHPQPTTFYPRPATVSLTPLMKSSRCYKCMYVQTSLLQVDFNKSGSSSSVFMCVLQKINLKYIVIKLYLPSQYCYLSRFSLLSLGHYQLLHLHKGPVLLRLCLQKNKQNKKSKLIYQLIFYQLIVIYFIFLKIECAINSGKIGYICQVGQYCKISM